MLVLITYDVNTETAAGRTRLRKVAKQCVNYGRRVQNSVFECIVNGAQCRMLKGKLQEIIDEEKELDLSLPNPKKNLTIEELLECLNMQDMEIKALRKELHLAHMSSMFSTVKSFKGDISKRYKYSEKTDTIYDTANNYGQYDKILDKKEVTMLLNEYNTLLEESNEE